MVVILTPSTITLISNCASFLQVLKIVADDLAEKAEFSLQRRSVYVCTAINVQSSTYDINSTPWDGAGSLEKYMLYKI